MTTSFGGEKEERESTRGRSGKRNGKNPPMMRQLPMKRTRIGNKEKRMEKEAPCLLQRTMSGERMWHGRKWDARGRIHKISEPSLASALLLLSLYWHLILIHTSDLNKSLEDEASIN